MTEEMFITDPEPPRKKAKAVPLDETELTKRLRQRYTERTGNGSAWAFIAQVRNAAAFQASRTIDALAMSTWPSRGLTIYAHEIKSARSDWLRELKNPDKAETFAGLVDRFYVVVGAVDIVQPGELPETWGLMVPHAGTLKVAVEAPELHPDLTRKELPPSFNRSFLAALLRAATEVGQCRPAEVTEAREEGLQLGRRIADTEKEIVEHERDELRRTIQDFERAAGVSLRARGNWGMDPEQVGRAVRAALDGTTQIEHLQDSLKRIKLQAEGVLKACEERTSELG